MAVRMLRPMLGRRPAGVSVNGWSGKRRVVGQRRLIGVCGRWCCVLQYTAPSTVAAMRQLHHAPLKNICKLVRLHAKEAPTWEGGHEQALQVLGPACIALIRLNVVQLQAAVAGRQAWWQTIRGSRISSSRGAAVISGVAG